MIPSAKLINIFIVHYFKATDYFSLVVDKFLKTFNEIYTFFINHICIDKLVVQITHATICDVFLFRMIYFLAK